MDRLVMSTVISFWVLTYTEFEVELFQVDISIMSFWVVAMRIEFLLVAMFTVEIYICSYLQIKNEILARQN